MDSVFGPNLFSPGALLPEMPRTVLDRLKQIDFSDRLFKPDPELVSNIQALSAVDLKKVLDFFLEDVLQRPSIDPVKTVKHLATILPAQVLAHCVGSTAQRILEEAKTLSQAAVIHSQMTQKKSPVNSLPYLSRILSTVVSVIDMFMKGFGIGAFLNPAREYASSELKVYKLIGFPTIFYAIKEFILYFDPENNRLSKELVEELSKPARKAFEALVKKAERRAKFITGAILASFLLFSLIWPFIKPRVAQLYGAENWTEAARKGLLKASRVKSTETKAATIAAALQAGLNVILVGPPRTGKSKLARLFTILQAEGLQGAFKDLRHRTVFFIPTSKLSNKNKDGNTLLEHIEEEMRRDRDNLILILEEFQGGAPIFEKLKTRIEEDGAFPPIIAITTIDEYTKYIASPGNEALAARFYKIDVNSSDEEETLQILEEKLLQSPSHPIALERSLKSIYRLTSEAGNVPQPHAALELLNKCIQRTSDAGLSKAHESLIHISAQLRSLYTKLAVFPQEAGESLNQLQVRETRLQEEVAKERTKIGQLHASKRLFHRVTEELFISAIKVSEIGKEELLLEEQNQFNEFLLLGKFLREALINHLTTESGKLRVKTIIDDETVAGVHNYMKRRHGALLSDLSVGSDQAHAPYN